MVEVVISVVAEKVTECLLDPVARPFRHLFNYRRNITNLNQQIDSLDRARQRLYILVDEAEREGYEIFPAVQNWMKYAQGIMENRDGLTGNETKASMSCFYFKSRYVMSKRAKRDGEEIAAKIIEARDFINGGDSRVSYRPPPPTSVLPLITSASFKDYEAFESRESTFNQIMEALRNEGVRTIGLWGMGGVGKTTLVKQVAKQAEEGKLFRKVVVVLNISQTPDMSEIQRKIARMLGVTFEEEEDRAVRLRRCLKRQGKILVILDDLWEKLELGEIGIPHDGDGDEDDQKGCKLLLTSRERRVLDTDMRTQMEFHLRHLNEEEAWSLFKRTIGDSVYYSPDMQRIAIDIVKKCDGLPVAIVTVANALKRESARAVWENALEELSRSAPTNIRGVSKNVYSCLELSYNHLEGEEVKSLFLLCGLMRGGDIPMEHLLQYAMGLNLFKGFYSWEKAANKLITLVERLKVSSLLLDNEEGDNHRDPSLFFNDAVLRMHDVVQHVARSIASKDPHRFSVNEVVELREWQRTDEFRNCSRISLMCRNMDELPQQLLCPQLEFFSLNSSNDDYNTYPKIPDDLFQHTKQLRVLDLSKMSLSPSPSTLCFLSNLQTLCMRNCWIKDIAAVGELKRLQILSLADSHIEQLPKELMELNDLRVLDLRNCQRLRVIPRNVISSLSQLEYLNLKGCFNIKWDLEGSNTGERTNNACLSELKHLSGLRGMEVQVSDLSSVPEDYVIFDNLRLTKYSIEIGDRISRAEVHEYNRASTRLVLNKVESVEMVKGFSNLLKRSQCVHLEGLSNYYELGIDKDGFRELKYLTIASCPGIHSIPGNAFSKLEELELEFLNRLEAVCEGPIIPEDSFLNLRTLSLKDCERLKYAFCRPENIGREYLDFPQLQSLSLENLMELISFYNIGNNGSQKELITFFNHEVAFPALESLNIAGLPNVNALWHNQLPTDSFSKLNTLTVSYCNKLLNVFPLSVAKALVQLEDLCIEYCEAVETIVVANVKDEEDLCNLLLLPKLTSLQLDHLPQLKTFCSTRLILGWPLLKTLEIFYCIKVDILFQEIGKLEGDGLHDYQMQQPFFFIDKPSFPCLEFLNIQGLDSLKTLWQNQLLVDSFSKLKELKISSCRKLLTLFPSNILPRGLRSLEILKIRNCDALEEIFHLKAVNGKATVDRGNSTFFNKDLQGLSFFPNLQSLEVLNCPHLKYVMQHVQIFCCGGLETVVSVEDGAGEMVPSFSFPKLTSLTLIDLPKLKRFSLGRFTSTWPLLKELEVQNCDEVQILFQEIDDHLDDKIQPSLFLVEKVSFPSLELLKIEGLDSLKALWHNQLLRLDSFSKLKGLKIDSCDKLLYLIPSNIILKGLRSLEIRNCDALEKIFDLKGINGKESVEDSVGATHSGNKLLNKDLPFQNLQHLKVSYCPHLKYVFPVFVGNNTTLMQLRELRIVCCELLERIVTCEDDEDDAMLSISFPELTSLTLINLPQLKNFSWGRLSSTWPLLKELEVQYCDKVRGDALSRNR